MRVGGDGVERGAQLRAFTSVRIPAATKRRRVGLAGGYFLREKPPVKTR
jgi:hypothetical protein